MTATPAVDVIDVDMLAQVMKGAAASTHASHTIYEEYAGRWARTMHRRLMAQGIGDEDAARLCRMMRDELNRLARSVIETGQQMVAVQNAAELVNDEVARAQRLTGRPYGPVSMAAPR